MRLYKYHGAGNDFLLADNRWGELFVDNALVKKLCDRHFGIGADGFILLEKGDMESDFSMVYYNSDGSGGMMCGNGARCLVAFAKDRGIGSFIFRASDGLHQAWIIDEIGNKKIIKLRMSDVLGIRKEGEHDYFLDTGTFHFVRLFSTPEDATIDDEAIAIRHSSKYLPAGTNVNYAYFDGCSIYVNTFEKGVEAVTLACGTGIVATALTYAYVKGIKKGSLRLKSSGGEFTVDFIRDGEKFKDICLTGPTEFVASIDTVDL